MTEHEQTEHEPTASELAEQAVAEITATWDRCADALRVHPDLAGALKAAGALGDGVRALVDERQRPLRGEMVERLKTAGASTVRALAASASISRSAAQKLITAARQDAARQEAPL